MMENHNAQEKTAPVQFVRGSRAFRQFKNPPQPHMCIQDTIRDSTEKLFINVLGWQKIANPKQYSDPIPLYGGMQVHQGCGPNSNRPPLLVFAVMVNPGVLKANGKNAANPTDRDALVSLLCDFVEAMNPGLVLARKPIILKDRDLTGELKDVWLAVQNKREREKGMNQDVMYKVYDIDGIGNDDANDDGNSLRDCRDEPISPKHNDMKQTVKSSKQILLNAGQKSEFDSGMNNFQLSQNSTDRETKGGTHNADTTYCTPVYGQIVSSRENHNQINDIQQKLSSGDAKPSTSVRRFSVPSNVKTAKFAKQKSWDDYSKRSDVSCDQNSKSAENTQQMNNGKAHYDFFPVFDNKTDGMRLGADSENSSKIIVEPMNKLTLHSTDNNICDSSALGSVSS